MIKWNSLYNTSPNLEIVEILKIRHLLLCLLFASKFGDLRGIKLTSSAAFLKKKPHNQTWANNSTGDCYSSITRRLDNNSCKYTWQSMVITRLEPNSSNYLMDNFGSHMASNRWVQSRYLCFKPFIRLEDEPWVWTPIFQSLLSFELAFKTRLKLIWLVSY